MDIVNTWEQFTNTYMEYPFCAYVWNGTFLSFENVFAKFLITQVWGDTYFHFCGVFDIFQMFLSKC